ncbi:2Fe-2S iron-sulfur cluster-binding protein [Mycobacterium intracellulare]|uniref:2Fe-2S iron-sulfur cluster-binding protein n=1 Tax=Mycobacterium intracellulare TaxID=1767 RepID=UPI000D526C1E
MTQGSEFILQALLRVRSDAPFACTVGVCSTCRARCSAARLSCAPTSPSKHPSSRQA